MGISFTCLDIAESSFRDIVILEAAMRRSDIELFAYFVVADGNWFVNDVSDFMQRSETLFVELNEPLVGFDDLMIHAQTDAFDLFDCQWNHVVHVQGGKFVQHVIQKIVGITFMFLGFHFHSNSFPTAMSHSVPLIDLEIHGSPELIGVDHFIDEFHSFVPFLLRISNQLWIVPFIFSK